MNIIEKIIKRFTDSTTLELIKLSKRNHELVEMNLTLIEDNEMMRSIIEKTAYYIREKYGEEKLKESFKGFPKVKFK
jgi:hypothetical protein